MTLELMCASGDGTALSVCPSGEALVCVDMDNRTVFLSEEQAIELIEYLEFLITGDSHAN